MAIKQPYQGPTLTAANTAPGVGVLEAAAGSTSELASGPCRAIYCGSTGNLCVVCPTVAGLSTATFTAVQAGSIIPVQAIRISTIY
jgi:hypothetical protein